MIWVVSLFQPIMVRAAAGNFKRYSSPFHELNSCQNDTWEEITSVDEDFYG